MRARHPHTEKENLEKITVGGSRGRHLTSTFAFKYGHTPFLSFFFFHLKKNLNKGNETEGKEEEDETK